MPLKLHIRKLNLVKRKTYNETDVIDKSKSISIKLFKQFNFKDFKIIHTFIPFKNEVNTWLIINQINEKYKNKKRKTDKKQSRRLGLLKDGVRRNWRIVLYKPSKYPLVQALFGKK